MIIYPDSIGNGYGYGEDYNTAECGDCQSPDPAADSSSSSSASFSIALI